MKYMNAEMELVKFSVEDVIATSTWIPGEDELPPVPVD